MTSFDILQLYAVNITRSQYKLFSISVNEKEYLEKILKNTNWSKDDTIAIHDVDTMSYAMKITNLKYKKIE